MKPMERSQIPLDVRLTFSRAAIETIAQRAGIRLLHIKGDTTDPTIRAPHGVGSDVDALIEPHGFRILHWHLLEHGWSVYSTFFDGSPFGHAQTYHHEDWGYFDLHRRFPGIRISDREAFHLLWDHHGSRDFVGIECAVPSLDAQAVLLMLNAARDGAQRREEARGVWEAQRSEDRIRRRVLVARLGADVAFDVTMGQLERHRGSREYPLWRAIVEGGDRSAEWWARVVGARTPFDALQTLLRAPFVNRSQLTHELGRAPSANELASATAARLAAAARELLTGGRA